VAVRKCGLIKGTRVEKALERRRGDYKLMPEGKKALNEQRRTWSDFLRRAGSLLQDQSGMRPA
jgi:hypothetical protein